MLFEGDDYIGSAVNMASRLCDRAKNVDVLMPTMQLERLPEGIDVGPVGEIELRGFPGRIGVVRRCATAYGKTGTKPWFKAEPACCWIPISPPARSPGCWTTCLAPEKERNAASSPSAPSTAGWCGG